MVSVVGSTRRSLMGLGLLGLAAPGLTAKATPGQAVAAPLTFSNLGNEVTLGNAQNAEYAWKLQKPVTLARITANVAWCILQAPSAAGMTELLWSVFVTRNGTNPQQNGRINQYTSDTFGHPVQNNAPSKLRWDVKSAGENCDVLCNSISKGWTTPGGLGASAADKVVWDGPIQLNAGDYLVFYAAVDCPPIPVDVEFHLNIAYC